MRDAGTLTLDQGFDQVRLAGFGLDLSLNGFRVDRFLGSEGAERLMLDGDAGSVSPAGATTGCLARRDDVGGAYSGGLGNDVLRFAAAGPATLTGSAVGFERVELAGGALAVTGALGTAGTHSPSATARRR